MRNIQPRIILFFLFIAYSVFSAQDLKANSNSSHALADQIYKELFVDLTDKELETRINAVTNLFEPKFTSEVKSYLRVYLTSRPQWTQTLLGRTAIYFPIFERKIEERGLPNDVKFISIIESALRTGARSRVGAQGLWQFMPGTAKMNDLVIDSYVDEREDPYRATDAALEYLSDLYARYHDWALAIAAYNSGPGRVNQAIAISGARNFWKLRDYLPKETRNYVPAFLAAAYMMKYYTEHYLTPESPRLDFQLTRAIKIYDELTFSKISSVTGMSMEDIRFLNTSYRKDLIPSNKVGFTLLIPARVAHLVESMLNNVERKEEGKSDEQKHANIDSSLIDHLFYEHVLYDAQPGEKLSDIAELFNVDKYNIRHWNMMGSDEIIANKPLLVHYIKNENKIAVSSTIRKFVKRNKISVHKIGATIKNVQGTKPKMLPAFYNKIKPIENPFSNLDLFSNYRLRRGESLQDVLRKNPDLSLEDIIPVVTNQSNKGAGLVIPIYP